MTTSTRQSVIGIVYPPGKDKVLLIKRCDVNTWALPGGGVDDNESPEEAVVREILEETGIHVRICRQTALYTPLNRLSRTTHVFECEQISGHLILSDETHDLGYFSIDKLPKSFFFLHRKWIDDAQRNLPHMIREPITQVTYWKFFKYLCAHPIQVMRMALSRFGHPINTR